MENGRHGVDWKRILKYVLEIYNGMLIGFMWLRVEKSGQLL
jgi:hypothetical protein